MGAISWQVWYFVLYFVTNCSYYTVQCKVVSAFITFFNDVGWRT